MQPVHDEVIFHWALDGFPIGPFDANRKVDPQNHRFDHNVAALLATVQSRDGQPVRPQPGCNVGDSQPLDGQRVFRVILPRSRTGHAGANPETSAPGQ
jgi:hypothetical protein